MPLRDPPARLGASIRPRRCRATLAGFTGVGQRTTAQLGQETSCRAGHPGHCPPLIAKPAPARASADSTPASPQARVLPAFNCPSSNRPAAPTTAHAQSSAGRCAYMLHIRSLRRRAATKVAVPLTASGHAARIAVLHIVCIYAHMGERQALRSWRGGGMMGRDLPDEARNWSGERRRTQPGEPLSTCPC